MNISLLLVLLRHHFSLLLAASIITDSTFLSTFYLNCKAFHAKEREQTAEAHAQALLEHEQLHVQALVERDAQVTTTGDFKVFILCTHNSSSSN